MIIVRTPYRISFFGGGTDYPAWYLEHGGAVLATSIDKYCYITCRYLPPFFEHKYRLVYSRIETVQHFDEFEHPAARAVLKWADLEHGLEIHHDGDLPARSGLGSSSSFTVSLVHALSALQGKHVPKEDLAKNAIYIEQEIIKENVGSQDQISAAFGGFNRIEFKKNNAPFEVAPIILNKNRLQELQGHLMLFFTGFSRIASEIAKSKIDNFKNREKELKTMSAMVDDAIQILQSPSASIEEFGQLLHQSWLYKRSLSDKISTPEIDDIYNEAMKAGAIGGKILGAGGGGFLLLFAKPEVQPQIRKRLQHLIHVPFEFESSGSRVVLYQPNGLS
ncbi:MULTISPECIES: kinase [Legionella]|uniref:D-glycero-alpha-D-manno-heptose 7-phosphate kinase n=1 Tax=Legionella maceachernii TaxID=466 RepID=A0A0W0VVY7_9GAMM|nr:kinase [Legionella maceachernii]KTD24141.1 D-glycero-alpha-D-manno-heptose 7-phosphate kinase [Legionella maceachernii]SJZ87134.1 D-glycero-alpha-D-manno-heptose-7-phosphate kinase [Legionella maceachernii]SUO98955.1 Galactokinase [Legionella maceachernii]